MTEREWLTCTDPKLMLEFLRGKVSERKLRLSAVACCRRISRLLLDERVRKQLNVTEYYVDGRVNTKEWRDAADGVRAAQRDWVQDRQNASYLQRWLFLRAYRAVGSVVAESPHMAALVALDEAARAQGIESLIAADQDEPNRPEISQWLKDLRSPYHLILREVFGNPFRPVAFDLAWQTPSVVDIAQTVYDERRFTDMPVLADALEEANCTSSDILDHCRNAGEHVHGCWLVDLLLGRQ